MSKRSRQKGRRGSANAGRKRKEGERYANGRLKPAGPPKEAVERRRAMMGDGNLNMASNPMDFAFEHGWIGEKEHRTAAALVSIYSQCGLGSRGAKTARLGDAEEALGVQVATWSEMPDDEVEAVWDRVFSRVSAAASEDQAVAAMKLWRRVNFAMTPAQRNEVWLVCVMESWPQWMIQRHAGRTGTKWEHKRELLIDGLSVARVSLRPPRAERPIESLPAPTVVAAIRGRGRVSEESTVYVNGEGEVLLEVVRRRRC